MMVDHQQRRAQDETRKRSTKKCDEALDHMCAIGRMIASPHFGDMMSFLQWAAPKSALNCQKALKALLSLGE
jgi:hypothetical protein